MFKATTTTTTTTATTVESIYMSACCFCVHVQFQQQCTPETYLHLLQVMMLGVTNPTEYRSPNSDYMTKRARKAWLEERAFVALTMAASRGYEKMCTRLIQSGM